VAEIVQQKAIESEGVPVLEQIHNFNVGEKQNALKELAKNGIDKVKSFFSRTRLKKALLSVFGKNKYDDTITEPNEEVEKSSVLNADDKSFVEEQKVENVNKEEEEEEILKEFDSLSLGSIKADVLSYYRNNHLDRVREIILTKYPDISEDKLDIATERALNKLTEKNIMQFKDEISEKLQKHGINEKDFWQWRFKNPPQNAKAQLVRDGKTIKLKYTNFISDREIDRFLQQHVSTLGGDFFNEMRRDVNNIYTSEEIDKAFDEELGEFIQKDDIDIELISKIGEYSNGWVDAKMVEGISNLPVKEALRLLGNINEELKPKTREMLDKYYTTVDNDTRSMGQFLRDEFAKTDEDLKQNIGAISDLVAKLNKQINKTKK